MGAWSGTNCGANAPDGSTCTAQCSTAGYTGSAQASCTAGSWTVTGSCSANGACCKAEGNHHCNLVAALLTLFCTQMQMVMVHDAFADVPACLLLPACSRLHKPAKCAGCQHPGLELLAASSQRCHVPSSMQQRFHWCCGCTVRQWQLGGDGFMCRW